MVLNILKYSFMSFMSFKTQKENLLALNISLNKFNECFYEYLVVQTF